MKWLYLIFVVNLFGQLQSESVRHKNEKSSTKAHEKSSTKAHEKPLHVTTHGYTMEPFSPSTKVSLGVALIYQHNHVICSGIHLKPWLLLTIADCLYGKTPETLHAMVTLGPTKSRVDVSARFYEIHPGYHYNNYMKHNLAILVLNSDKHWDVGAFNVSFMTDDQKHKLASTYVDEWYSDTVGFKKYYFLMPDARKAINMTACKAKETDGMFCVKGSQNLEIYNKEEIGIPFYEWSEGDRKHLIGLNMGFKLGTRQEGHVFLNVMPNFGWIIREISNYPSPPSRH